MVATLLLSVAQAFGRYDDDDLAGDPIVLAVIPAGHGRLA